MNIDVNLTDNSDIFLNALPEQIEKALIAIGLTAESHAKQALTDAPAVVTGRLRNSITYATETQHSSGEAPAEPQDYATHGTPEKGAVYIGTNVEYAQGIETGSHRKKGGVHYLMQAATQHSDEYKQFVEDAMKEG